MEVAWSGPPFFLGEKLEPLNQADCYHLGMCPGLGEVVRHSSSEWFQLGSEDRGIPHYRSLGQYVILE